MNHSFCVSHEAPPFNLWETHVFVSVSPFALYSSLVHALTIVHCTLSAFVFHVVVSLWQTPPNNYTPPFVDNMQRRSWLKSSLALPLFLLSPLQAAADIHKHDKDAGLFSYVTVRIREGSKTCKTEHELTLGLASRNQSAEMEGQHHRTGPRKSRILVRSAIRENRPA